MISLKILRNETEMCKRLIASKQGEVDLDHVISLDKKLRRLKTISNEMRAERNSASEAIGKLKKAGEDIRFREIKKSPTRFFMTYFLILRMEN